MVNKCTILGNVGKDPEVITPNGTTIAKFSVATSETFKDKAGEKKTETQWHNVVAFGKLAEIIGNYVKKGSKIYIEGKIKYGSYEDKEGNKKYTTDIIASQMTMLDSKGERSESPVGNEPIGPDNGDVINALPF